MDTLESACPPAQERPRTLTVMGLLVAAALLFAWLGAYAVVNALVTAEVISQWPKGQDPRPRWMIELFAGFLALCGGIGGVCRWLSRRQLRKIDAMEEEASDGDSL